MSGPTSGRRATMSWRSPAGAAPSWRAAPTLGTEVEDTHLLAEPLVTADVVVTRFTDRSLGEVGRQLGRGVALRAVVRGGLEIPYNEDTIIERGDLLRIAGNALRRRARR